MIDATNAVEIAAIGGRATICLLIHDAILKGTIEPIKKSIFHTERMTKQSRSKPPLLFQVSTNLPSA
jgi:hypothetical protein